MSTITMTRTAYTAGPARSGPATGVRVATARPGTARVAPAATSTTRRPAGPVRLTRRGRWVATLLILGVILGLSLIVSSGSVASFDRGVAPATETVVVDRGDTLWGIATQAAGPGETRDMMYEIEQLNHLSSSALVEGQELVVPVS